MHKRSPHYAWLRKNGHIEVVEYIMKKGSDIHAELNDPSRVAAQNGHLQIF
jgi:hypothetical protein